MLSLCTTVLCVMSTIAAVPVVGTPETAIPPPARPATLFATKLLYTRMRSLAMKSASAMPPPSPPEAALPWIRLFVTSTWPLPSSAAPATAGVLPTKMPPPLVPVACVNDSLKITVLPSITPTGLRPMWAMPPPLPAVRFAATKLFFTV